LDDDDAITAVDGERKRRSEVLSLLEGSSSRVVGCGKGVSFVDF
jgi:hypothetical protein